MDSVATAFILSYDYHVTYQYHGNMCEPLIGLADVGEASLIEEDLLQDEGCDSF